MKLPQLQKGERYAGLATDPLGKTAHHVILLPGDVEKNWSDAQVWATLQGGELPTRIDQLVLLKHLKSEFKLEWYWSDGQSASTSDYAWCQSFNYGGQVCTRKNDDFRARAVRKVPV